MGDGRLQDVASVLTSGGPRLKSKRRILVLKYVLRNIISIQGVKFNLINSWENNKTLQLTGLLLIYIYILLQFVFAPVTRTLGSCLTSQTDFLLTEEKGDEFAA